MNIQEIHMFGNSIHPSSSLNLTFQSFRDCVQLLFGDVLFGRVSVNAFFTTTSFVTLLQCGMNDQIVA